jgi:hypothetical protein
MLCMWFELPQRVVVFSKLSQQQVVKRLRCLLLSCSAVCAAGVRQGWPGMGLRGAARRVAAGVQQAAVHCLQVFLLLLLLLLLCCLGICQTTGSS